MTYIFIYFYKSLWERKLFLPFLFLLEMGPETKIALEERATELFTPDNNSSTSIQKPNKA